MTTLLHIRGIARGINSPLVGRVTKNIKEGTELSYFLLTPNLDTTPIGNYIGILTSQQHEPAILAGLPVVYRMATLSHLEEGDIVVVSPEGNVNTLYRIGSRHNTLLLTERCNSNCLMCSQPPKDRDDIPYFVWLYKKLIPMIPKDCMELGLTGGEPMLLGDSFFELLELLKLELPGTELHILTNGRLFAKPELARRYGDLNYRRSMLGIPLYSDYYQIHDHTVQAKGAFTQTISGLYNLAKYDSRIEIRIVLHQLTIPRLVKLAQYIYKNLPFVEHIAFMGLENMGYTRSNFELLWMDPVDYQRELTESVMYLITQGMNVSIYNIQLCLMPEELWPFMRKSISDWKNIYLDECQNCSKLSDCGGLFASSAKDAHSRFIKAFNS